MRRRAAHIKIGDRRAVIRPTRHRPQEEKLFERELTLKDISLCQAKFALQVKRRKNLPSHDDFFYVRRELRDRVHYGIAERFALLVPRPLGEFVRSVLYETGQNVF